jgi:hypothetical protein
MRVRLGTPEFCQDETGFHCLRPFCRNSLCNCQCHNVKEMEYETRNDTDRKGFTTRVSNREVKLGKGKNNVAAIHHTKISIWPGCIKNIYFTDQLDAHRMAGQNMFNKLPTEVVRLIGETVALAERSPPGLPVSWRGDHPMSNILSDGNVFSNLVLVDKRFNAIFTPLLYRKLYFRFPETKSLFMTQTAPNTRVCEHITALYYTETWGSECKLVRLGDILPMVPLITTLRLIGTPKPIPFSEGPLLLSLPRLKTLEILMDTWTSLIAISLQYILPQIQRLVILALSCTTSQLYSSLTGLKALEIRSKNDAVIKSLLNGITSNELEELTFKIPYSIGHRYSQWFRSANLDRWKKTLKIFRYHNTRVLRFMHYRDASDDEKVKEYLKAILENCDFVWI